jgi:hypothetical protein
MTDNSEQLKTDRPRLRPSELILLAMAILMAAAANLEAAGYVYQWHSRHPAEHWVSAVLMPLALQLPWAFAVGTYRRIRKAATAATGISSDLLQLIRGQTVFLVFGVYLALVLILESVEVILR